MSEKGKPCDLCVVGAGPAGLAAALSAARHGLKVTVLEAGAEQPVPGTRLPTRLVDPRTHAEPALASAQALGGTGWLWGGRCVPLGPIAFRPRKGGSGWPIDWAELSRWTGPASQLLACSQEPYVLKDQAIAGLSAVETRFLEQWSRQPTLPHLRVQAAQTADLDLHTDHRVIELIIEQGRVAGVRVQTPSGPGVVSASRYVLAAGGLETTRLLLAAQKRHPNLFGGASGVLGKGYMGHLSGKIADVAFAEAALIEPFHFFLHGSGYARRRLTLTEAALDADDLYNIAFWPDNPPFYDASHRTGALSAVYLGLRAPVLGRLLLPEAIRLVHVGHGPLRLGVHLTNILRDPVRTALDLVRVIRHRLLTRPRRPGFLVRQVEGLYALHYHAEQGCNPQSQIRLDDDGVLEVDLRFSEADARSVVRAHQRLDTELRAAGAGRLEYRVAPGQRAAAVLAQASDGFHQLGATRMGRSGQDSVVDPNCRVHGLANLYIASSSVFPTSGQANPTLTIVALALRLADHLTTTPP